MYQSDDTGIIADRIASRVWSRTWFVYAHSDDSERDVRRVEPVMRHRPDRIPGGTGTVKSRPRRVDRRRAASARARRRASGVLKSCATLASESRIPSIIDRTADANRFAGRSVDRATSTPPPKPTGLPADVLPAHDARTIVRLAAHWRLVVGGHW